MSGTFGEELSGLRKCVAYGDHVSYEKRVPIEAGLRQQGWLPVEWAVDSRTALNEALPQRPAAVRALVRGLLLGLPVVVVDPRDMRSRAELLKYAAAGETLGVPVHLADGPALRSDGGTDEFDFALRMMMRELFELRQKVLTTVGLGVSVEANPGGHSRTHLDDAPRPDAIAPPGARIVAPPPLADAVSHDVLLSYRARYERQAALYREKLHCDPPRLPVQADSPATRRRVIGQLAAYLFSSWYDRQIAELLNELGIRTEQGGGWYAQRVTYYRRTYGRGV